MGKPTMWQNLTLSLFPILYATIICDKNDIYLNLMRGVLSQLNSSLKYASVLAITSRMKIYDVVL